MVHTNGSGNEELDQKLSKFYNVFLNEYQKTMSYKGIHPRSTVFGLPHDVALSVDISRVIIVLSEGTATSGMSNDCYRDLSSFGVVDILQLCREISSAYGWNQVNHMIFPRNLLDASEETQRIEFSKFIQKDVVDAIIGKMKTCKELGITESMEYLKNARARFEVGGGDGYSDCKSNCRNAITSLMIGLTGSDRIRDGIKKLEKEGLLGERESEVIQIIENLTAKIFELSSKTGSHPPMATENDAKFTLQLTEATIDYLISTVAHQKGL